MSEKQIKEYIRSQSMATGVVTVDDLVCKDCAYKGKNLPTSFCNVFRKGVQRKPNAVLLGGKCPAYAKE